MRTAASPARIALVALLAAAVLLLAMSGAAHRFVLALLEEARQIAAAHPSYAMALIVVFSALAAMLAFVSTWVVVPFAVLTWGPTAALFLMWTGWLMGGIATYTIGRFLGRPAVRYLVSAEGLARYEQHFVRHMPFSVVLLVQLALPSEIPGYLLGMVGYSFTRFIAALSIVELVYGIATVYLGEGFLERRMLPVFAGLMLMAVLAITAAHSLRRRFRHA